MLLEGVGVADSDGDDFGVETVARFGGEGADVVVGQQADVAVVDLLGGVLPAPHPVELRHILDGGDQHVHMVGEDGRHHGAGLFDGPECAAIVEVQPDPTLFRLVSDGFLEGGQQVVALVFAVRRQSEGDAGGVEELTVFERGLPVHHTRVEFGGGGVHPLVDAGVFARRAADFVDEASDGFGFGCPDDVVGVEAVFSGDVAQHGAVGVRGHARDVARWDAQTGQTHRQRVFAARHREVDLARALRAFVVGGGVAQHRLAEGDERRAATGELG